MVGITFGSKGATNKVDWRAAMVSDLVAKREPPPGGGSVDDCSFMRHSPGRSPLD
jgi:hypothetical protein